MPAVRSVACAMVEEGVLVITQKGKVWGVVGIPLALGICAVST